jgi:hypothetical protein
MATKNPITGDLIKSKYSDSYADKFDAIFRKPKDKPKDKPKVNWVDAFSDKELEELKDNET